ncbi:DUF397 domain-containing protein [Streptomyces sp. ISL-99]|nr:DUF397 domain-containing protein [Streptomyces sp. ISL-99]MBT2527782.1 DUF397 domain-containing protein [Streptomyces sp. ISL-99]
MAAGRVRPGCDSKNLHLEPLRYTATEWRMFREAMVSGEL